MGIRIFDLERIQSLYENTVPFNLTESGFHPYSLRELLSLDELAQLQNERLGYGQTNGSIVLRQRIAHLYDDLNEDNVLVCNGSSEANFVACHTLLEPGDEIVIMLPNYMQIWGASEELGAIPRAFKLSEKKSWKPNLDELSNNINAKTKVISICNPNNPTGYVLSKDEMDSVIEMADKFGIWIYCDEVYRGAELNGVESESFIGKYEKVLVSGGLSKAYALPGLRIGWLAGPKELINKTWSYHDYTSISTGALSQIIAEIVLVEKTRQRILERNRDLLNKNLGILEKSLLELQDYLSFIPPKAGGMAFMRYSFDIKSKLLSDRLRKEYGVFLAAGEWFGMENFIRLGIGGESLHFRESLEELNKGIIEIIGL